MAVPSTFADLSTTPLSNGGLISNGTNVADYDDHCRTLYAFVASIAANSGNGWTSPYLTAANPSYTGSLTGSTSVVNIGNQIYKDGSGAVGINTGAAATTARFAVKASGVSYTDAAMKIVGSGSGNTTITHVAGSLFLSNDGASDHLTIDSGGNVYGVPGTVAMTDGFFYIPAAAGAPVGTPATKTGHVPMYYDASADQFYVFNGGWKKAALT